MAYKGLYVISKEGKKAVDSILNELENNNYLTKERKQDLKERFYYEYNVYEVPYTQKGLTD